ncbi:MAG TPA: hypothetical protein DIS77_07480 [Rothia sp.]|nr:hypothetical protein [Rothia sp. (in: high G+C Gram-positive bacteria)]
MTGNLAPITHLPTAPRTTMVTPFESANTGEKPIRCLAQDGQQYWCKAFDGLGVGETVVNEIISIEIGKAIGAPVCDWSIVDIPDELAGTRCDDTIISRLPMFGSQLVSSVITDDPIRYVGQDDNYHRFPRLIALWYMCNAEDIQMMYCLDEDYSVYSIDQGYWFGSHEMSRELAPITSPAGQTRDVPRLTKPIPLEHWSSAIQALEQFNPQTLSHINRCIPGEWGVDSDIVDEMVTYAIGRIPYALDKLRYHQKKSIP